MEVQNEGTKPSAIQGSTGGPAAAWQGPEFE